VDLKQQHLFQLLPAQVTQSLLVVAVQLDHLAAVALHKLAQLVQILFSLLLLLLVVAVVQQMARQDQLVDLVAVALK
jgi:hypothetical protein